MQPIPYETEWKTANKPVHSILMIVFVDNAKDLPLPKSNVEPSPFFELTFANATQRTPIKARTSNPVYQSKFIFLIKESSKDLQALNIKAVDSNTSKSLGEMNIPLSSILDQSDMEVIDKIYQMQHGIHTSSVTLSIRVRVINFISF
jgi:Ca2+-dependent lipid-binding protein